jgi:riboflavin synthase
MFTGIVQAVGRIVRLDPLEVECPGFDLAHAAIGDSICVQGVCLTVTSLTGRGFTADVSAETLRVTTGLEHLGKVNLEKALRMGDALGGHLVTGHVDGVGSLLRREGSVFVFRLPRGLSRLVARKGSIAVDGVSLTVNRAEADRFEVNLIPHTLEVTTLGRLAAQDDVNLEIDLIARYVARLLESSGEGARSTA